MYRATLWKLNIQNKREAIMSPDERKKIIANRFILEDENRMVRAELSVLKKGPMLALYDENGTVRAELSLDDNEPMLALYDKNGKPRAGLAVLKKGPGLALCDENGKAIWEAP